MLDKVFTTHPISDNRTKASLTLTALFSITLATVANANIDVRLIESGWSESCQIEQLDMDASGDVSIITNDPDNDPNSCASIPYTGNNVAHNMLFSVDTATAATCDYLSIRMGANQPLTILTEIGCQDGLDTDLDGIIYNSDALIFIDPAPNDEAKDNNSCANIPSSEDVQIASTVYTGSDDCTVNGYIATGQLTWIGDDTTSAQVVFSAGTHVTLGSGLKVHNGSSLSVLTGVP